MESIRIHNVIPSTQNLIMANELLFDVAERIVTGATDLRAAIKDLTDHAQTGVRSGLLESRERLLRGL
ncbi:hypothetical protein [Rhabdochromatium marinum]|uniref:hypothetical protein n=1 Tax=Rhabdochromatium marinum TaxID=48729 RepID=UPI001F5BCF71|nr:hypothetical protein [Rhabdochromatium marinum]